jgi:protein transport protein SEC31
MLLNSFSDSNRRQCSVLQWNPDMSTQLIVASDDDNSPSLRVITFLNLPTPTPQRKLVKNRATSQTLHVIYFRHLYHYLLMLLQVWDVRRTVAPVREFVGHSKGLISLDVLQYLLKCMMMYTNFLLYW